MKRFLFIFLLSTGFAFGQTYQVKVDANGNILHNILVKTVTNPDGKVNFATDKLLVNGVPVTTGGGGGGSGTVTSVGVSGANGIGVTGSPVTISGIIALSLGNITPASVAATGTVTGSNLSGTNTGDQDLSGLVPNTRMISTVLPLFGGGSLSTDLSIGVTNAVANGTTKGVSTYTAADFDASSGVISLDYANAQSASASTKGFLTSADWTTFNNKGSGTVTGVTGTAPIVSSGGTAPVISIADAAADGTTKGAVSFTAADFNATAGNISIDYTNGQKADVSNPGFLTEADWIAFNSKGSVSSVGITGSAALGISGSPITLSGSIALTLDPDLENLAAMTANHVIPYRLSAGSAWNPITIGAALVFKNGVLDVANNPEIQPRIADDTIASAATLDLTGLDGPLIQVTGTNDIDTITLAEGETRLLRFSDALTLVSGASMLNPGGEDITTAAGGWVKVYGGAAGVVTLTNYTTAEGFSRETFDQIFINDGGDIGFPNAGGAFTIGKNPVGLGTTYLSFASAGAPVIRKDGAGNNVVELRIDLLGGGVPKIAQFPNKDGTFAYLDDIPTLADSADLRALLSDENGTGVALFDSSTGATLATPVLNGLPTGTGVASAATASTLVSRDANGNSWFNNPVGGFATFATASLPETLTVASAPFRIYTGSTAGTVTLPVVSTLTTGHSFWIVNDTGGALLTVNSSGGNAIKILPGKTFCRFTCKLITGTSASSWQADYPGTQITSGKKFACQNTLTLQGTDGSTLNIGAGGNLGAIAYTGNVTESGSSIDVLLPLTVAGDTTITGDFISTTAGKGLQVKGGTNARAGNATLVAGTVTVSNTTVDSTKDILLVTRKTSGGTIGMAITYTLSNATSFTISSDNILDTSTISYMLVRVN